MLEKIKVLGKKIRKKPVNLGIKSVLPNMKSEAIKKLFISSLIFVAGYSLHYLPDVKITKDQASDYQTKETIHIQKDSIENTIFNVPYLISAPTKGLADTLAMAMDELSLINPMTAGFVEYIKKERPKIVIIPDSLMNQLDETMAFYQNDQIFIRADKIRKYRPLKNRTKFDNIVIAQGNYRQWDNKALYNDLLHEGRHVMQARAGILLLNAHFFNSGNLLDYMTSNMFVEGDATSYANYCLDGKGKGSKFNDFNNFFPKYGLERSADYYRYFEDAVKKGLDIKHSISPNQIADSTHWSAGGSSQKNMNELNKLFTQMPIPLSYNEGTISYEKMTEGFLLDPNRPGYQEWISDKPGWDSLIAYIPILDIDDNRFWWESEKNLTDGKEKLRKLREDPEFARKFFEDNLKKQRPDLYGNDSIAVAIDLKKNTRD